MRCPDPPSGAHCSFPSCLECCRKVTYSWGLLGLALCLRGLCHPPSCPSLGQPAPHDWLLCEFKGPALWSLFGTPLKHCPSFGAYPPAPGVSWDLGYTCSSTLLPFLCPQSPAVPVPESNGPAHNLISELFPRKFILQHLPLWRLYDGGWR